METALRTRLLSNTTAQGRVDWGLRPQGKDLPAIRLTLVSSPRDYTMDGPQNTQHYRVQADCYATTFKAAKELGDAVTAILEPSAGDFLSSFVIGQRDAPEITDIGPVHCRTIDFRVTHVSA